MSEINYKIQRLNLEKQRRDIAGVILWELQNITARSIGVVNRLPYLLEKDNLSMNILTKYLQDSIDEFKRSAEKLSKNISKFQKATPKINRLS